MTKSETYTIRLAKLNTLDDDSQEMIRSIRNEDGVRKWMYTDHIIGAEEHKRWLDGLNRKSDQIVFAILDETGNPLGVVSANDIDYLHKKTSWGLYLTSNSRGGLGSAIEYNFINFIFDCLDMEKLNCEVLDGNDSVIKLHKKFMFQSEGLRTSEIIKEDRRISVHMLGLTKDSWLNAREDILKKYHKILHRFSVSIQWDKQ